MNEVKNKKSCDKQDKYRVIDRTRVKQNERIFFDKRRCKARKINE